MNKEDRFYISQALVQAEQSKCISKKVGCVIAKDGVLKSSGFNATAFGCISCEEAFANNLFTREEHHEWSLMNEIHAEMNALAAASKRNYSVYGATLYSTLEPCDNCLKSIVASGIKRIVYIESYKRKDSISLYRNCKLIKIEKYENL